MMEDPVVQSGLLTMSILGWVGIIWFLVGVFERARMRWGQVPVIDPMWRVMRDGFEWLLRLPGRVIRWNRRRDTPRGLGGP